MSDISTFIRRGQNDTQAINKLQALITPLAFPEPEESAQKERVILSNPVRERINSVSTGLDITTSSTDTRDRFGSSITIIPDTSTPSAFPVSPTVSGTLTFTPSGQKYGAGATFNGSQYISLPDDNQLDLTLPYFTMAFWYKGDGSTQGTQTIWSKGSLSAFRDFCLACGDFDTGDFSTILDTDIDAGLQVQIIGDAVADYESASSDFDVSYSTTTTAEQIKVVVSDGTNFVEDTVTATNIYDGNWHSIVIISQDSVEDYCSACTDFDTGDFITGATPVLTVYMDKVSLGTIDHSSVTGDLSNTSDAIIGAEDTNLTNPLKGTLALLEYQGTNWSTDDVDSFHDDARIRVNTQKAAFHFIGNTTEESTLANIY